MAKVIGPREIALKAMTEQGRKAAVKAPKVGGSKPIKAYRDMTDAERAEFMKDPQGIQARAAAESAPGNNTAEDELSPEPSTLPTKASAKPEKAKMAKKAKAKKKPTTKAKAAKASVKKSAPIGDGENKTDIVLAMLQSAKGCTSAEVCERTGWAAVSIPPIAKRAKLKLRKEPEGRGVRYFATAA
jgi:hypothetical protein